MTISLRTNCESSGKIKIQHDRKINSLDVSVNDWVYVFTPTSKVGLSKKLIHQWHGPFKILEINRPTIKVRLVGNDRVKPITVHLSRVKKAKRNEWNDDLGTPQVLCVFSDELDLCSLSPVPIDNLHPLLPDN